MSSFIIRWVLMVKLQFSNTFILGFEKYSQYIVYRVATKIVSVCDGFVNSKIFIERGMFHVLDVPVLK